MDAGHRLRVEDRSENEVACLDCGQRFPHITGYVSDARATRAVYFASTHTHGGGAAKIDVTLGTWGVSPPADDHVTFSCELRPEGAMALDAPQTLKDAPPLLGRMLTRDEALGHELVTRFWEVVDVIAEQDPAVRTEVYGDH